MRQTLELGDAVDERELDRAGRAVTLLADDDLGHAGFLAGVLGVVLVAVDKTLQKYLYFAYRTVDLRSETEFLGFSALITRKNKLWRAGWDRWQITTWINVARMHQSVGRALWAVWT